MMPRSRLPILLALVTLACAGPAGAQPPRPSIAPPLLHGTIDLRIGDASETRDPYIFGYVDGLALDGQGRIIVAESSVSISTRRTRWFSGTRCPSRPPTVSAP